MPESIYTGKEIPAGKWCITIITFPGPSASASDYSGGTFAGHAHMAFEWRRDDDTTRHVVFHLVGVRKEVLPGAHVVYNTASIERFIPGGGRARSVGGRTSTSLPLTEASDTPADWFGRKPISTASILVDSRKGLRAFGLCRRLAAGVTGVRDGNVEHRHFSLIGANVGLGTNCIGFCQQVLRDIGVEMNWTMYLLSFISLNTALTRGSLYERSS